MSGAKITDLPTHDETALVDEIAHAMAEADGIRYWKFDDGEGRAHYQQVYRAMARRHMAAHRILIREILFERWVG